MTRIDHLKNTLSQDAMIISNPISIYYYIGQEFDVGERLLALIINKDKAPVLFLNEMFENKTSIQTVAFKDSDDIKTLLSDALPQTGAIAVDGGFSAKFLLPLFRQGRTFVDGSYLIESQRAIKTKEEQDALRHASKLNDDIMASLVPLFKEGVSERELADIILKQQSTHPLSGPSFTPIVLFSENIANPHGLPSNRTLKKGDAILVDMGGIYNHYCSDMTRTFFYGSNPELETLYHIVLKANLAAIDTVKPGVKLSDIDKAARDVITQAGYGAQFIHRTGHGIGIECHETLDVSSSNDTIVQDGMCFSIEPGIYVKGLGGIRIEDLVIVTSDGCDVINTFPKGLEENRL
ncbi:Xaa-Pro dipeptidase [Erysipelothrix larvae]|uniref:Xaa-Pro dipeptidase n=1 Tax=Erysipelothrix larvae TaxID=1514105 RepID=A0A109UGV4_9FIRM|nr:Xaa-Pro peptidase family protein [Erysipelothrix larvae]AMC93138.1 Xaa-Pro dipeptidase [Erysipelothrix larvae]